MTGKSKDLFAASADVVDAAKTPTVIDADELDRELLDRWWRDFCHGADRYVAESTRRPRSPS